MAGMIMIIATLVIYSCYVVANLRSCSLLISPKKKWGGGYTGVARLFSHPSVDGLVSRFSPGVPVLNMQTHQMRMVPIHFGIKVKGLAYCTMIYR